MNIAKQNDFVIDLSQCTQHEIKELKTTKNYCCIRCQKPVRLRSGSKRKAHFAHITPCSYGLNESESEAHFTVKKRIGNWLQAQGIHAEIEQRFSEIGRIADVYFVWNDKKYVIEIQKSYLSELAFQERIRDYERLGMTVLWIFIGAIKKKKYTYVLNSVMALNKESPLISFHLPSERLILFQQITWISSKEIQAQSQSWALSEITVASVLNSKMVADGKKRGHWLEIKAEFRKDKWRSYMMQERKLLQICAKYRINLALLPAEIGWPIVGYGFSKSIFIWQAYILMAIKIGYDLGECFTLADLLKKLQAYYGLAVTSKSFMQVKAYIDLLIRFAFLQQSSSYYAYKRELIFYERLEQVLLEDERLSLKYFK